MRQECSIGVRFLVAVHLYWLAVRVRAAWWVLCGRPVVFGVRARKMTVEEAEGMLIAGCRIKRLEVLPPPGAEGVWVDGRRRRWEELVSGGDAVRQG